jgi:hypothetical protein
LIFYSSFVDVSKLYKQFLDLPKRLNLDILYLPCEIILSNDLLFVLLLWRVRLIADSTSIGESVMHSQFLL